MTPSSWFQTNNIFSNLGFFNSNLFKCCFIIKHILRITPPSLLKKKRKKKEKEKNYKNNSNQTIFLSFNCLSFNSAFVTNASIFLCKSESLMRLKTLYCWLILFFNLYTKYFIYNFVITRRSEICSSCLCCFSIIICFFTKPLTLGILFSASLIFVLKTIAITNPLTYGIFLLTSSIFFSKFWLLVFYWFMQTKVISTGIFFSKLPTWVFRLLYFGFFSTFLSTTSLYFCKSEGTDFNSTASD